jgi:hypothetical protein
MYRIEYKIDIDQSKRFNFLEYLKTNKAINLYEKRIVNSIYFDNENFEMYFDSIEGLAPRKKIRLRYYGSKMTGLDNEIILLENKHTNFLGRYKVSKKTCKFKEYLRNGILDAKYGICNPKTIVSYLRSYYLIKDFRITFDENIKFQMYNGDKIISNSYKSNEIIVEIKTNYIHKIDELKKIFSFTELRSSKYCMSIEKLFKI